MFYAIISEDKPNTLDQRMAARPAHLERLIALKDEGRLLIAGPHPAIDSEDPGPAGFTGSLVVAEFNSLESAQEWANDDPYLHQGVYERVVVKPYKKVLP
ncbi:YciI family protein [Aliamphritea spongicola]|uniref:YciI family protein n=1 Tax=Aliamphritea spongicola TaxID=707589 RepID=UPI00196A4B10|nr:YciI family protein [Aliamphritea spongicola]MBN3564550.1 YciI family protein [Aliamphritea spongicola]